MGCAIILVVGIAVVVSMSFFPTIASFTDSWTSGIGLWDTSPLHAIIPLLPFAFLCLIIIAIFWVLSNLGKN
jgi:uncharacterized BrkB/YihY/UPF0761 family membrane protein